MRLKASKYANIPVSPQTKDRLDRYGYKNETYDELINRVLDVYVLCKEIQSPLDHEGIEKLKVMLARLKEER
ncbi:MAG: hypothetical protein QW567_04455 [Candidatus Hadarchaeales archaeon]